MDLKVCGIVRVLEFDKFSVIIFGVRIIFIVKIVDLNLGWF